MLIAGLALAALASVSKAQVAPPPADMTPIACPASVGASVRCLSTRDESGAWLVVAMPAEWNRRLIVHAHGGPRTGTPEAADPIEDLDRFAVMVRQGYAWVGSTYRRGGYGVRMAAEDVDRSREVFQARFGRPERTILHGQSWGGNVAAKASELYALDSDGGRNYDGVLLTNGVLSGGTQAYQFRAGLRAVYQFYCRNHPGPDEVAYPVWQGLPRDSRLTRAALRERVEACTGVNRPAEARTADQAARLRDILAVTGVQEDQLVSHLSWATFLFQDMVQERLGGRNPFDNMAVIYAGSHDDQALNAGVERFAADPDAVARLAYDSDLSGLIVLPTLTMHALHDPTVSYAVEAAYAKTVAGAGRSHLLVQVVTDEDQHSKLGDAGYVTALMALEAWLGGAPAPDPGQFQAACIRKHANPGECRFLP
jgi:hypothetical protein